MCRILILIDWIKPSMSFSCIIRCFEWSLQKRECSIFQISHIESISSDTIIDRKILRNICRICETIFLTGFWIFIMDR